jgi:hypothetical protein
MGDGRAPEPRRAVVWLARLLPTVLVAALFGALLLLKPSWFFAEERGRALNEQAWEAGFTERGLAVPERGPREGYWGARLSTRRQPGERWVQAEGAQAALFAIDAQGHQHLPCRDDTPCRRLLVTGGSVGWGAYASTESATWFAHLARALADQGQPHAVTVAAAGGWKAFQEVFAGRRALALFNDVDAWLMMTGLNELTNGPIATADEHQRGKGPDGKPLPRLWHARDWDARVDAFMAQLGQAKAAAAERGVRLVVVLQPALVFKQPRSALEAQVAAMSVGRFGGEAPLVDAYAALVDRAMALRAEGVTVVDCSRAFDGDANTVFADLWHFSDVGHERLGACAAAGLSAAAPAAADAGTP